MQFSISQQNAITQISNWLKNKDKQLFVLGGYAGTGKTTIASHIAGNFDGKTSFVAMTGKAALVLQQKGCEGACTLHSAIYSPVKKDTDRYEDLKLKFSKAKNNEDKNEIDRQLEEERGILNKPEFMAKDDADIRFSKLIIVDEYSMMTDKNLKDLINAVNSNTKILLLGDPEQLPPVQGENNIKPDYVLQDIHRQADGSNILDIATKVRSGDFVGLCDYGDFKCIKSKQDWELYRDAGQVLTGKNDNRKAFNRKFRAKLGFQGLYPKQKDKIICTRNDMEKGLLNGMIGNCPIDVREDIDKATESVRIDFVPDGSDFTYEAIDAWAFGFLDTKRQCDPQLYVMLNHFDYAYAITVHKSQGSEWDNVVIYDDNMYSWDSAMRKRWLYTAITRAKSKCTIVRP